MSVRLGFNAHGKGGVKLVKVIRHNNGFHEVIQVTVQILLEGDTMDEAYYTGDNAQIVPTDTCKNTVYCLAKLNDFNSIEDFGIIIARHFLKEYPHIVHRVSVELNKDRWERVSAPDSNGMVREHKHCFKRLGPAQPFARVVGSKKSSAPVSLTVTSGIRDLTLLKTTQSGFVGFHKDRFTSLPESTERFLGTSVLAEWTYAPNTLSLSFNAVAQTVEETIISTFAGPADKGVYSPSVQQTLYFIGRAVLTAVPAIASIRLSMPNLHNFAFPLEKYGIKNEDHTGNPDIFYAIDDPHGMIQAVVERSSLRSRM